MTPILYKENETDFNHRGLGSLVDLISAEVTEEENGHFGLIIEYPANGIRFKDIKEFSFVKAKPNSQDEPHIFRIYELEKNMVDFTITIYAVSKTISDLQGNLVKKVSVNNSTPQIALNNMKANLIYPTSYDFYSDITTKSTTEWIRRSPLSCIAGEEGSLLHYWGGEIKRGNQIISLLKRRGKDNVATIRYGKNLGGLTANVSFKGMVTRILPHFTHTPKGSEKEVTVEGNLVDSQYISNYPIPFVKEIDFSNDDDVTDLASLNVKAKKYFSTNVGVDKPSVNMSVDIEDVFSSSENEEVFKKLEKILLFDTVTVYYKDFDVNITAKINKLAYDPYREKNTHLEIGSTKNTFVEDIKKDTQYQLNEVKKELNYVSLSADGKNRINYGSAAPIIANEGDLWYNPSGEFTIMYIFDGAYWQPVLNTEELDNVSKEVDTVIADMIVEKERINQTITKADQAIADAGFAKLDATTAKNNAVTAVNTANTAKTNAEKAISDVGVMSPKVTKAVADASAAVISANTAKVNAGTALINADKAIADVNVMSPKVTKASTDAAAAVVSANIAKTNAETALTTAQTGLTNSATALDKAGQALAKATATETATGSLTTSYDALTKTVGLKADKTELNTVNGTVTQHDLDIKANATAIGVKADKSVVDTINQTVATHSLSIKATADSLASKAEKTLVDSLSGTVATHSTTLTQSAKDIALKADSTTVNAIKGTVDTHTTGIAANAAGLLVKAEKTQVDTLTGKVTANTNAIGVNATAITARLTSTQIESLLTTKKYVNETQLSATASGIEAKVSKVTTDLGVIETATADLKLQADGLDTKFTKETTAIKGVNTAQEASIKANADGIALRATKAEVDAVKGTVDGHTTAITANATAITTKASQSSVNTISGTVGTHTTQLTQTAKDIALKAEKTLVDSIKGTVDSHTTQIVQTNKDIALKADSSVVNTISGKVTTQGLAITANSNGLALKANKDTVDRLEGTVSSLGTDIDVIAGEISNKVWKTDIESAVDELSYENRNLIRRSQNFEDTNHWEYKNVIQVNGESITFDSGTSYIEQEVVINRSKDHMISFYLPEGNVGKMLDIWIEDKNGAEIYRIVAEKTIDEAEYFSFKIPKDVKVVM